VGRGDVAKVRSANDRQRKLKERHKRQAEARAELRRNPPPPPPPAPVRSAEPADIEPSVGDSPADVGLEAEDITSAGDTDSDTDGETDTDEG
jgi:hypothetical protein